MFTYCFSVNKVWNAKHICICIKLLHIYHSFKFLHKSSSCSTGVCRVETVFFLYTTVSSSSSITIFTCTVTTSFISFHFIFILCSFLRQWMYHQFLWLWWNCTIHEQRSNENIPPHQTKPYLHNIYIIHSTHTCTSPINDFTYIQSFTYLLFIDYTAQANNNKNDDRLLNQ